MRERRQAAPVQPLREWQERPRTDAYDKVTGRTAYIDDLPLLPLTAHAVTVRSPYSHARIVRIDSSRALAVPGVLAVLDRDHLEGIDATVSIGEYGAERHDAADRVRDQGLLAIEKARFDGDLVAMVAAEDRATAERAAQLVEVEWEVLEPVYGYDAAVAEGAPLVHDDLPDNTAIEDSLEWGDVDAGFAAADEVFEEEWYGGSMFHHPMEPATSCIADFRGDQLDLWAGTHKPFAVPALVADTFGIPRENVRVRVPPIGGGFGAKQITPAMFGAAALSRRIGRPVKYVATEAESFRSTSRHAITYRAKVGVQRDGTLVALDVDLRIDTGAYFTGAGLVTHNACISAWGCYRLPHFRVRGQAVYTNQVPSASFRATGKNQTTFGVECTLDSVARRLGLPAAELKKRNALRRGEYVTDVWRVRGEPYEADTPPLDTDFTELVDRALAGIGWDGVTTGDDGTPREGSIVRGRGLALSLRHGAQQGGRAHAMVSTDTSGVVTVHHNAPDLGTGVFNMLAVVCAQELGIDLEQVRVGLPDTNNLMPFGGTSAQRTTVQMGNAVQDACRGLARELGAAAAQARGGSPDDWTVRDGRVTDGSQSYGLGEVAGLYHGSVTLRAIGSYSYAPSADKAFHGLDSWAPGAAAAEVLVDLDLGEVRVVRYAIVGDAGKTIHHMSSQRQLEGGVILGLGGALFEELQYGGDQLLNGHPFRYPMPKLENTPPFHVSIVENADGPGPFGAKGLSQTSLPCVAPAIGNAIRDATGVYLHATPFTPERVLDGLGRLRPAVTTGATR